MKKSKALFFVVALVAVVAFVSFAFAETDDGQGFDNADLSSIPESVLKNILAAAGNNVTSSDFTTVTFEDMAYSADIEIVAKISADVVAKDPTKSGATVLVRPKKITVTRPGYVALVATRDISEEIYKRIPHLANIETKDIYRFRALDENGVAFQSANALNAAYIVYDENGREVQAADDLDTAYVVSTASLPAGDYAMYSAIPETSDNEDKNETPDATTDDFEQADLSSMSEELLNNILASAGDNVTLSDFTTFTLEKLGEDERHDLYYKFSDEIIAKISADVAAKDQTKSGAGGIMRALKFKVTNPGYIAMLANINTSDLIFERIPYLVNIGTIDIYRCRALDENGIAFQAADDADEVGKAYVVSTKKLAIGDYVMYSATPKTVSDDVDNDNTNTPSIPTGSIGDISSGCNAGFAAIAALAVLAFIKKSR